MMGYIVNKIAVIGGTVPKLGTPVDTDSLTEKQIKIYVKAGYIVETKKEEDTTPLSPESIEEMSNAQLRAKVKELGLETEDQKSITLKAALLAAIQSEPQDDEIEEDDEEDKA
jgi:hypothetical protein